MAKVTLPRYLRAKRLANGGTSYFWERPSWAKPPAERNGRVCTVDSEALGTDLAAAIGKADRLNAALDEWRIGVAVKPAEGTVRALFAWYRGHERFRALDHRTKATYLTKMDNVETFALKTMTFGERRVSEVEASHADAMYAKLVKDRGKRTGAYCMQVCRRVWNEAIRSKKAKAPNPFAGMNLKMVAEKGNVAATRQQYDLFRETARALGIQSMATAAAISFELLRRVTDVYGYQYAGRDDGSHGFFWEDYVPGERFAMRQGKTGDRQVIPLRGDSDPESGAPGALLYPSLEEELARTSVGQRQGHIVINEKTGKRYDEGEVRRTFNRIKRAAGLPANISPTSFRHGGATELGDAGVYDIRPVSGHRTLHQTTVYNKASEAKARSAGSARQKHVADRSRRKEP